MFFIRCLSASAACGLAALSATAEPCEATEFTKPHGEAYLEAETALFQDDDASKTLVMSEKLLNSDLNCLERLATQKLRANALAFSQDYDAAIDLLEQVLESGAISKAEQAKTMESLSLLHRARKGEDLDFCVEGFGVPHPCIDQGRLAQPKYPPEPVYPAKAVEKKLSGRCEVTLDVSRAGKPENVRAECSDPVFEESAINAMKQVEYAPKVERGERVARTGVVYPIEYQLD